MPILLWFCVLVLCCIDLLGCYRAEGVGVVVVVVVGLHPMGRSINDEKDDDDHLTSPSRPRTVKFKYGDDPTLAQLFKSPKCKPKSPLEKLKKPNNRGEDKLVTSLKANADVKSKQVTSGHAGKSASSVQNKVHIQDETSLGQAKSSAVLRAQKVQLNLGPEFPSFVKSLVRSHVSSCFWMGLPGKFCKIHLPEKDTMFNLEDESGRQYKTKYIACKTGLSAGWRQFVASHKLLEGDVLVFQLVEPTKFKVYIIKANGLSEVDGALGPLYLDACRTQNGSAEKDNEEIGPELCTDDDTNKKRLKSLRSTVTQTKKKIGSPRSVSKASEQSESNSEEVGSEVMEDSKSSEPALQFKDIKDFENFYILVDGLLLDSELPEDIRRKYYKLCCSQNEFLHENMIRGLNYKLVVGIIAESVIIAEAIISSKITTSREDFSSWETSIQAFELLGMNVGFIHARLCELASIAYEAEVPLDARRYRESRSERYAAQIGLWSLETKLVELQDACHKFSAAIKTLGSQAECYNAKYQEVINALW